MRHVKRVQFMVTCGKIKAEKLLKNHHVLTRFIIFPTNIKINTFVEQYIDNSMQVKWK